MLFLSLGGGGFLSGCLSHFHLPFLVRGAGALLQSSPELLTVIHAAVFVSFPHQCKVHHCIFKNSPFIKNRTDRGRNNTHGYVSYLTVWWHGSVVWVGWSSWAWPAVAHTETKPHQSARRAPGLTERPLVQSGPGHKMAHTQRIYLK